MSRNVFIKLICFFTILFAGAFCFSESAKSMANVTVDVDDEIYSILSVAETHGYCSRLSNYKPYSESYILKILDEISENLENRDSENYSVKVMKQVIENQKSRFVHEVRGLDLRNLEWSTSNGSENCPITFFFNDYMNIFLSGGLYTDSGNNSLGYDVFDYGIIYGKITDYISYKMKAYLGLTCMPLTKVGDDYVIGQWWDTDFTVETNSANMRTVNTFKNYAVLPYTYKKPWSGSIYYLSNVTASGLEGWPVDTSLSFGMEGEIHSSLFDDRVQIGLGRYSHELASMDTNSSLVLNAKAQPFFGMDLSVQLTDVISFNEVVGWLEFPNQGYINENAWYDWEDVNGDGNVDDDEKYTDHGRGDSLFFQNMYVAKSLNFDTKYVHFDIGSSVVFPKRFELGYMFPMVDCVIYQNSLGDFDNLSLFADIKGVWPGVGYVWGSAYLDEMNQIFTNVFEKTRCMFAYQAGVKAFLPWLPFGNISFRYTKVEPYCYTHNIVVYHPYSKYPVAESYTNNGYSLGYYMPPNSDEFLIDFNFRPTQYSTAGLSYQLTRHGTDWGSGAVAGSNLYSELTLGTRENLRKYFLYDGTYEWTSAVNLYGSFNFRQFNVPIKLNASVGYLFDWFTGVDTNGEKNDSYHYVDNNEYSAYSGAVISVGVTVFGK